MSDPNSNKALNDAIGAIDELTAMTVVLFATEAFLSMPLDSMPREMAQGVLIFYEALMTRSRPKLPQTEPMQHVHNISKQAEAMAARIRKLHGLPTVV